jgi:hypothetical protein
MTLEVGKGEVLALQILPKPNSDLLSHTGSRDQRWMQFLEAKGFCSRCGIFSVGKTPSAGKISSPRNCLVSDIQFLNLLEFTRLLKTLKPNLGIL